MRGTTIIGIFLFAACAANGNAGTTDTTGAIDSSSNADPAGSAGNR